MVLYENVKQAVEETIELCHPDSLVECTIPCNPYDIIADQIVVMFKYSSTDNYNGFFYIKHIYIDNALSHHNNGSLVAEMFQKLSMSIVLRRSGKEK